MCSTPPRFEEYLALSKDGSARLSLVRTSVDVALPPVCLGSVQLGLHKYFDTQVNSFSEALGGVLLAFRRLRPASAMADMLDDSPYLLMSVSGEFIVFRPVVGAVLPAVVNRTSRDHVGCLIHCTFNASIPRPRGDSDLGQWEGDLVQVGDTVQVYVTDVVVEYSKKVYLKGSLSPPVDVKRES